MERGQQWLQELLNLIAMPSSVTAELKQTTQESEGEPGGEGGETEDHDITCWLTINETSLTPEQIQILIGPNGAVLDAVQYLASTILNIGQESENQRAYIVELDGYRARRQAELQAMAEYAVEQVRQTNQEFEMKSLSSAERRQVHTILKPFADIETYSRGREPDRRLVVRRLQS